VKAIRALLALLFVTVCSCGPRDQAADPLQEARRLAEEGRFEEALQKHIWLHDHVLEAQPSYYGVRLSFALAEWIELGKKYPKALQALKAVRDTKTSRLLAGERDRPLFHDVESINDYLGESKATIELFKKIEAAQPEFAVAIYDMAAKALIEAKEFSLAKKYLGDPIARFTKAKDNFNRGIDYAKSSRTRRASREAYEIIFTDEVLRIIVVLDKAGDHDLAHKIQSQALAVLESQAIRDAIKN